MKKFTIKRSLSSTPDRRSDSVKNPANFWEPGNFGVALKRLDAAPEISNDLITMFDELIEQEAKIARFYVDFSAKWKKFFSGGKKVYEGETNLYGSTKISFNKVLELLDEYGKSHIEAWTQIQTQCIIPLKNFNDDNNQLQKKSKSIKEDFLTAQQPYIEVFSNLKKSRTQYVQFCVQLKPEWDLGHSIDMFKDIDPKKSAKRETLQKRYEEWNNQMAIMIPHYTSKMKEAYKKCDEVEENKLLAIKQALYGLWNVFSLKDNDKFIKFVKDFNDTLNEINVESDIVCWGQTQGPYVDYDFYQLNEKSKPVRSMTVIEVDKNTGSKENCNSDPNIQPSPVCGT